MSMVSRIALGVCVIIALITGVAALVILQFKPAAVYLPTALATLVLVGMAVGWWLVGLLTRPLQNTLNALETGLLNFKDHDFSVSLPAVKQAQLNRLSELYNDVGEILRRERQSIYQRELLLDKVIQSSPLSMVLTDDKQRILYSNIAARHLFNQGRRFEGRDFHQLLESGPQSMVQAVLCGKDGLCSIETDDEQQTYHISQSQFLLNARHHRLYLFKQLTRELNRQEALIWKKVIRVISHELNNSLAPMSSMAHSGKLLAGDDSKLHLIFDTIADRIKHLNGFIQGYAKFSKLPLPQRKPCQWPVFVEALAQHLEFKLGGPLPGLGVELDVAQMEQVLINLIKNAAESGSSADQIVLTVTTEAQYFVLTVADRGAGMSAEVLQSALLPFYSTKQTGTGLGLTLCREIVEAHDGKMAINNRDGGGLKVSLWLPRGLITL